MIPSRRLTRKVTAAIRAKCCHTRDGVTRLCFALPLYQFLHSIVLTLLHTAKLSTFRRVRTTLTKGNSTPHHAVYRSAQITPR